MADEFDEKMFERKWRVLQRCNELMAPRSGIEARVDMDALITVTERLWEFLAPNEDWAIWEAIDDLTRQLENLRIDLAAIVRAIEAPPAPPVDYKLVDPEEQLDRVVDAIAHPTITEPVPKPGKPTLQQAIVDYLGKCKEKGATAGVIAKAVWHKSGDVSARLAELHKEGRVSKAMVDGKQCYWLTAFFPEQEPAAEPEPEDLPFPAAEPQPEPPVVTSAEIIERTNAGPSNPSPMPMPTAEEALDRDILGEIRSRTEMRLSTFPANLADSLSEQPKMIQRRLDVLANGGLVKKKPSGAYALS